jgi:hypothetical protein
VQPVAQQKFIDRIAVPGQPEASALTPHHQRQGAPTGGEPEQGGGQPSVGSVCNLCLVQDDGQAPFVLEQALAWKAKFAGDRVIVLAPHDDEAKTREVLEGIEIRRFKYWWPSSHQALIYPAILPNIRKKRWPIIQIPALIACEYLAARKLIKEAGIDFVFAHWVMPQGVVAWLLKLFSEIPYGLKNYSSDLRVFHRLPILGPWLARLIIGSSQRLICENSMLRQKALEFFPERTRWFGTTGYSRPMPTSEPTSWPAPR